MNILYVAPNINHHQVPLCKELMHIVGDGNFIYAVQELEERFRTNMGWETYSESWIIQINNDSEKFEQLFLSADVVICSVRDFYDLMLKRLKNEKVTFYYTERWFKIGIAELNLYMKGISKLRLLHPKFLKIVLGFRKLSKSNKFYFLAQGVYAAYDFRFLGLCKNRIYNWGYFTEIEPHFSNIKALPPKKFNILWCGRIISWKRLEVLIFAFSKICRDNNVHLTILGDGTSRSDIMKLSKEVLPEGTYSFLESQPYHKVREIMQEADVYVLPSDGYEGWGAVVNEAMAESCVVVGNEMAGAVKTVIEDRINGFIFKDGDVNGLAKILLELIENPILYNRVLSESVSSIKNLWSAEIASKRLMDFCEKLMNEGEKLNYEKGPMKLLM
jgi:glycosyltransferase involved in cell wall biosynthesis